MKQDVTCGVIRDLLPLYADEVAGEDSRALVEEHLKECGDCRAELERLRRPVELPPEKSGQETLRQWRRVLRRERTWTSLICLVTVLAVLGMLILGRCVGVPAGRIEQDARRTSSAAAYPLLSQVTGDEIALLLFQKPDGYVLSQVYVNRAGFDFGYHFRLGTSEPAKDRIYMVEYRDSILVYSLTDNTGAAQIELSVEGQPVTVYSVMPGKYFAAVLDVPRGAEDLQVRVLDDRGEDIPVHRRLL